MSWVICPLLFKLKVWMSVIIWKNPGNFVGKHDFRDCPSRKIQPDHQRGIQSIFQWKMRTWEYKWKSIDVMFKE